MKNLTLKPAATTAPSRRGAAGQTKLVVLVSVAFVAGLLGGAYWYHRRVPGPGTVAGAAASGELSEATKAILQRLDTPVEIRFYTPASAGDLPETLRAFAARVQQLLAEYERVGEGKIRLHPADPLTDAAAKASAGAEGVLPFTGNDGAICYLGITVVQNGRKQSFPQLDPEWEAALESDLSRAIARIAAAPSRPAVPAVQTTSTPAPVDPAISEELLRTIPDLESRTYEEAAKLLREATLAEFAAQANEMQGKVREAERHVLEAQGKQSESEQQAALKELQRIQSEQTEKLKEITSRLQARIVVLGRLKGITNPAK